MAIDKVRAQSVVTMFNAAVKSYNNVEKFRSLTEKRSVVEEFNSALQYYSTIETAFREVITNTLRSSCPNNLHEMIDILINHLNPSPLEKGIDLFYILRYKDTRNQASHRLKIEEQNPYPRLFLNAERFIKAYIDSNCNLEKWVTNNNKFDFADFMQKFSTSNYDQVRVLVVGPMHDYSKKELEILTNIHWNIILDFDPYSSEGGLRSALPQSNAHIIQLSQIEKLNNNALSIDYTTWVNCDGDYSLGIDSFTPRNTKNKVQYIPSMLEGSNSWKTSYNINYSRMNANKLLREFFTNYFSKMGYNTDIVCLMDYSHQIVSSISQAIEDSIDTYTYHTNMFFLDEVLSSKLKGDKSNYENSAIYQSTIRSFLNAIKNNLKPQSASEELEIIIPTESSLHSGVVSERIYQKINKNYYLLHDVFPTEKDEPMYSESNYYKELYNFSRGEEVKWNIIKKNEIARFDIFNTTLEQVLGCIAKGSYMFNIYHVAGFGGTTIAKQVAFHVSKIYPVLYMKSYDYESIGDQLRQVYSISKKRVVVFIEEKLFNNKLRDKDECIRIANATTIPYSFIFIGRRAQDSKQKSKKQIFIKHYIREDIDKLLEFNRKVLSYSDSTSDRKLLKATSGDFIKNLGEKNCCPFIINLSIFKDKFIKIDDYVEEFISLIRSKPVVLKVFVYAALFSKFINEGIPYKFVFELLQADSDATMKEFIEKFDPLLYIKYDEEYKIREISIRAPLIASALLDKLLGTNGNKVGYRSELTKYLKELISDFKVYFTHRLYANKKLRQLFIDKISEESEDTDNFTEGRREIELVKKYFSPVIVELWDKDNIELAASIFITLCEEYEEDPYFYAHAARYYAYTYRNFDKAIEYIDKAIDVFSSNKDISANVAPDIYHVKGMCLMKQLFAELDELPTDPTMSTKIDFVRIFKVADEAIQAFSDTRNYSYGNNSKSLEYASSAWLKLILQLLKTFEKYKMLKESRMQEYLETGESLVEDLEDIFVLNSKEDLLEDLMRKKQVLITYRSDISSAVSNWNNFYDRNKNNRIYENCLYACKHRYYLLDYQLDSFRADISANDQRKINKLNEDYKYSLSNTSVSKLKLGDLSTYISLVRFSNERIAVVSSLINNLYLKDVDKPDIKILFYRYILKFLSAYQGDRVALRETIDFMRECKERADKITGKTNSLEFYSDGNEMNSIISKKYLLKVFPEMKYKIYDSKKLGTLKGILKCEGNKTSIIPYDKNKKIMNGVEVFVNLKFNSYVSSTDNGQNVSFKMGFSYDGLRAENMSVRVISEDGSYRKKVKKPSLISAGSIVDFTVIRCLKGKNDNITALVGEVGTGENCFLHISKLTAKRRVNPCEMEALYDYCKERTLPVYLEEKNDQGWLASLYKAGTFIEDLKI